jgi:pilus assembly protein CpaB
MKTRRLLTALLMALVISGVLTAWLASKMNKPRAVQAAAPAHRYVGAAQNLDPGAVVQPTDLKMVDWGSNVPLEGASERMEDIVGHTILYPVAAGEPITQRQVSAPGAGIGLSARIPTGMRAISLKSDEIVGVAGFLLPGTHVDVLMTYKDPSSQDSITTTVLQDAQVLTTGQKMQADPKGEANTASVVTLLVTPDDAQKLTLASAQGSIHFVLRNGADHDQTTQRTESIASLTGVGRHAEAPRAPGPVVHTEQPQAPAEKKGYVVETIRGDKQSSETFK